MFIKAEPAEFFMYRVIMIFGLDNPNSENQDARDYMAKNELEPKYQRVGDFEGSNSEFMQFGGCYLGKHLNNIAAIQRTHVEVELLTAEIDRLLQEPGQGVTLPEGRREAAVKELVASFHQDSSFQTAENGDLEAVLDGAAIREAALALLTGTKVS
jgi:hypothetical protein